MAVERLIMEINLMGNTIKINDFADNTTFKNGKIIVTDVVVPPFDARKYHGVRLENTVVVFEKVLKDKTKIQKRIAKILRRKIIWRSL